MNWIIYSMIGLDILGVILALIFVFAYRRKFAGIKHYEEIRDKTTIRKKKSKNDFIDSIPSMPLSNIVGAIIIFGISIQMMPIIANEVAKASEGASPNIVTLLGLVMPFYVISLVMVMINFFINALKKVGLI